MCIKADVISSWSRNCISHIPISNFLLLTYFIFLTSVLSDLTNPITNLYACDNKLLSSNKPESPTSWSRVLREKLTVTQLVTTFCFLLHQKVHYSLHKSPPLVPIPSRTQSSTVLHAWTSPLNYILNLFNAVQILIIYFFMTNFNIIPIKFMYVFFGSLIQPICTVCHDLLDVSTNLMNSKTKANDKKKKLATSKTKEKLEW